MKILESLLSRYLDNYIHHNVKICVFISPLRGNPMLVRLCFIAHNTSRSIKLNESNLDIGLRF